MLAGRPEGANVYEAKSFKEAQSFADMVPDVVLLDYLMPDLTGLEMLKGLKEKWPGAAYILMTGHGDEEIAKSAIQLGASDYISKRSLNQNALFRMLDTRIALTHMQAKIDLQRQELETFAHILVHDFKAPIRGASFLAEQIKEGLENGDMADVQVSLGLLNRSTRQMSELIESLAMLTRVDSDEPFCEAYLGELFERAIMANERDISLSGAQVRTNDVGASAVCSAPQVAQVLQNLIANAIKYRGEETPDIVVSTQRVAKGLRVTVSDNGQGVPEEFRGRIFETFRRINGWNAPPGHGAWPCDLSQNRLAPWWNNLVRTQCPKWHIVPFHSGRGRAGRTGSGLGKGRYRRLISRETAAMISWGMFVPACIR
ncbi:response regulator receiver sensor signal transduction histidine kinase [Roseovarius marisflavi]|uniref:histidine kinase n=1 Tax=Roseovarius marisflavi TaxID=1054996 RepID=A0A1M6XKB1_9RHOB|nr:response regulator receiver sensor signal transduction histidine kinase [Roseovarius marisflavi]